MGFLDFVSDTGASMLDKWLLTRSYIVGYGPSQADVACYKQFTQAPSTEKYPHAARWYKHMTTYHSDFSSLPGDPSKAYSTYGPESSTLASHPAKAPSAAGGAAAGAAVGAGAGAGAGAAAAAAAKGGDDEEEEDDLFGSDEDEEESEEAARVKAERLAEYNKAKAGKVKPAAKSVVTMDVKPWDDETDMKELEANVKKIQMDGLVWGASKLMPVGFGIKKLQINLVIEDDKVGLDDLQAKIEEDEDHVQSTDIAAMQKL